MAQTLHPAAVKATAPTRRGAGMTIQYPTTTRIFTKEKFSPADAVLATLANIPTPALAALVAQPDLTHLVVRSHIPLPDDIFDKLHLTAQDSTRFSPSVAASLARRPLSPHQRLVVTRSSSRDQHALYYALLYNDFTAEELHTLPRSLVNANTARALVSRYQHRPDCLKEIIPLLPQPYSTTATLRAPIAALSDAQILSALSSYHSATTDALSDTEDLQSAFTDLIEIRPHLVPQLLQALSYIGTPIYEIRLALASSSYAADPEVLRNVKEEIVGTAGRDIASALNDNPVSRPGFLATSSPTRGHDLVGVPSYFTTLPHRSIAAAIERLTDQGSNEHKDPSPRHWDLLALSQNPNLDVAQAKKIATCLVSGAATARLGADRINPALASLTKRFPTTTFTPLPTPSLNPPIKKTPAVTYFRPDVTLETIQNLNTMEKTPSIIGDAGFLDAALHHSPDNWVRFLRQIDHVPPGTTLLAVAATVTRAQQLV